ncbi:MFS transporter [Nanoarchaeota archaeon]
MPYTKPHIHELLVHYFNNRELNEIYFSVFLKSTAESLISIFVPIYLYQLGFGIFEIALYYLIWSLVTGSMMQTGMRLNSKFGVKKMMMVGTLLLIFYYYLLNLVQGGYPFWIPAIASGFSTAFYWSAFHLEFARGAEKKKEGSEASMLKIVTLVAAVTGPLVGSYIIFTTSFSFTFFFAAAILLASVLPLFATKDFKVKIQDLGLKKIAKADTMRKAFTYQCNSIINMSAALFWPLFIYLTIDDIVSVGLIISLTSFLLIILIAYWGELADKDVKKAMKMGTYAHAPLWPLRLLFLTPFGLFISNFLSSATISAIDVSFNKIIYETAGKSTDKANYFIFREYNLTIGRIIILVAAMLTQSIYWIFIFAFFVTFGHLILLKEI